MATMVLGLLEASRSQGADLDLEAGIGVDSQPA